ncbi:MAG: hypothetical protein IKT78_02275 [Ruminiclostridium sp.]|nr:hypothetical protein [Ruminiclostridium sp.]
MKKLLATLGAIIAVSLCTTMACAEEAAPGASSGVFPGASSGGNVATGIILTAIPTALAAGALTVSGIVLKKKNK